MLLAILLLASVTGVPPAPLCLATGIILLLFIHLGVFRALGPKCRVEYSNGTSESYSRSNSNRRFEMPTPISSHESAPASKPTLETRSISNRNFQSEVLFARLVEATLAEIEIDRYRIQSDRRVRINTKFASNRKPDIKNVIEGPRRMRQRRRMRTGGRDGGGEWG